MSKKIFGHNEKEGQAKPQCRPQRDQKKQLIQIWSHRVEEVLALPLPWSQELPLPKMDWIVLDEFIRIKEQ